MLRIIVACLISNINLNLALNNKDRHEYNVPSQNNGTDGKGAALTNHFAGTKNYLNGKEQKVIIKLLTEKPLSKIYEKELETEKLSLGIQNSATEKATREWSAFRHWKENVDGKTLAEENTQMRKSATRKSVTEKLILRKLTTINPAIIHSTEIVKNKLMNNTLPSKAITKQQVTRNLESEKSSSAKTVIEKPVIEWSALRRLKEKVDEKLTTNKSLTEKTAFNYLQRNVLEKTLTKKPSISNSTTNKHKVEHVISQVHTAKKPTTKTTEMECRGPYGMNKNVETNFLIKVTTKKLVTGRSTTRHPGFYYWNEEVIEKSPTEKPSTRYLATKKKAMQNTLQKKLEITKYTTKKTAKDIPSFAPWKSVEKLLTEKKIRRKVASKKAAASKRAALDQPVQRCWDGQGVVQMPIRSPSVGGRKVSIKRTGNGKIVYKNVNNRKSPVWSMKVKGNRKDTSKKVINKKSRHKKGKNRKNSTKKTGPKRVANKTKRKKGKVKSLNRKASQKKPKRKKTKK